MHLRHLLLIATLLLCPATAYAKGGHGSGSHGASYSTSLGLGTGSKTSSDYVSGYTKKDGIRVDGYRKSTPDNSFNNNWSTKGNVNLATGEGGDASDEP